MTDKYLKTYMKEKFSFRDLKKVGLFGNDIKSTDYEKQAERICKFLGLKSIYDYSSIGAGCRYHLTDGGRSSLSFADTKRNTFGQDILKTIGADFENLDKEKETM